MIATVAHEMAHYYRAHALVPQLDACYDYHLGDKNPSCRPPQDPQAKNYVELVAKAEEFGWGTELSWPIDSVADYKDHILVDAIEDGVSSDSSVAPVGADSAKNRSFLELSQACPDYTQAVAKQRIQHVDVATLPKLRQDCFNRVTLGSKPGQEVAQYWRFLKPSINFEIRELPSQSATMSLDLWINQMAGNLRDFSLKIRDALVYVAASGYYTSEQEADDIAVEVLAKMGLDPDLLAQFIFEYFKIRDPQGAELCKIQRQNKWIDPTTAKPYQIDLGPKSDEHHLPCFRIRNVDQEIEAHHWNYKSVEPVAQKLPPAQWNSLLESVKPL